MNIHLKVIGILISIAILLLGLCTLIAIFGGLNVLAALSLIIPWGLAYIAIYSILKTSE